MSETKVCKVCIPNTFSYLYDYLSVEPLPPLGSRVLVPFRQGEKVGYIWGYGELDDKKRSLKSIISAEHQVIFDDKLRQFCDWLSEYYHSPLSEILALAVPKLFKSYDRPLQITTNLSLNLSDDASQKMENVPKRKIKLHQLYDYLTTHGETEITTLKACGFNKALLQQSLDLKLCYEKKFHAPLPELNTDLTLNQEQQLAYEQLNFDKFQVYVLHGVTGSGKTEVYIEWMRRVIQAGQQVLMLVPEIGLTKAFFLRLQQRLGVPCILMHSHLTAKQRFDHWLDAFFGHAPLVLGTRSAIFAPLANLGLIIVDEEHDLSFKQLDGIRYSAKDAAIMRAKFANIPIVLGSATLSLETYQHVLKHQCQHLVLTHKALAVAPLHYQVIDLRAQEMQHGLALKTLDVIHQHLQQGEQVLVFINRRGYAPILFCHGCGWSKKCLRCDAHMTWYRKREVLQCHHCGALANVLKHCESCASPELMPLGVGTEQLLDFLQSQFKAFKTLRFDRDLIRHKEDLDHALAAIETQEVQLIVGTQMLTKGHHFPHLGLVVVVDADSAFYHADFRAMERLGQMLTQVAGRAGRAYVAGEVLIQTHLPQHPLLTCLIEKGYVAFSDILLQQRLEAVLPPYAYLSLIRAQGKNNSVIKQFLQQLREHRTFKDVVILGPTPAPMEKKADIFRWQLILKSTQRSHLHAALKASRPFISQYTPKGVRCFIEVDPYDWSA